MDPTQNATTAPRHPAPVHGYLKLNYRRHYAELLRLHPAPPEAMAELCLFRFWLACRAQQQANNAGAATAPARAPEAWPLPRHASGFDVEYVLRGHFALLLDSRMELYDQFFLLARNGEDMQGLDAATTALSRQLFIEPPAAARTLLRTDARHLFAQLLAADSGARSLA